MSDRPQPSAAHHRGREVVALVAQPRGASVQRHPHTQLRPDRPLLREHTSLPVQRRRDRLTSAREHRHHAVALPGSTDRAITSSRISYWRAIASGMAVGAFSHSREEPSMSVSTAPSNWQVLVPRRRSGPRSRIAVASRTHCDSAAVADWPTRGTAASRPERSSAARRSRHSPFAHGSSKDEPCGVRVRPAPSILACFRRTAKHVGSVLIGRSAQVSLRSIYSARPGFRPVPESPHGPAPAVSPRRQPRARRRECRPRRLSRRRPPPSTRGSGWRRKR